MNEEAKLFNIFYERMQRMYLDSYEEFGEIPGIKLWRDYIHQLGMEFVESCDDDSICVRDPLRHEIRYISVKKELALKILFLGELP